MRQTSGASKPYELSNHSKIVVRVDGIVGLWYRRKWLVDGSEIWKIYNMKHGTSGYWSEPIKCTDIPVL